MRSQRGARAQARIAAASLEVNHRRTACVADMKPPRPRLLTIAIALAALAAGTVLYLTTTHRRVDAACSVRNFEGSRFIVCTLDTRRAELRLVSRGHNQIYLRTFAALNTMLGRDASRLRFAMNAGMFNDAGAPIGLYVEDGAQGHRLALTEGPGNFHLKPNGVFWQDDSGALHIDASDRYVALGAHPRFATQSGPMLVIDGALHPRFAADGASHYIRNGVGVLDARTAYFVISDDSVSFGRFARFFRDGLHCRNALFLDGSVSSLWAPNLQRRDDNHLLGPMIVVLNLPAQH